MLSYSFQTDIFSVLLCLHWMNSSSSSADNKLQQTQINVCTSIQNCLRLSETDTFDWVWKTTIGI